MASRPLKRLASRPEPVVDSRGAADLLCGLAWPDEREAVALALLDGEMVPIRTEWLGTGGPCSTPLFTRRLLAVTLATEASGVVLAHNHPSARLTPSAADLRLTRELAGLLRAVGVVLVDHLIVGGGRWLSMRDAGLV